MFYLCVRNVFSYFLLWDWCFLMIEVYYLFIYVGDSDYVLEFNFFVGVLLIVKFLLCCLKKLVVFM